MTLTQLTRLIRRERTLKKRIDAEIREWVTIREHNGITALRMARTGFTACSLRQAARRLDYSPAYLSLCEQGKLMPSRKLMLALHETFGVGGKDPQAKQQEA